MISNTQLDDIRDALMDEWEHSAFFIWHREYKDYEDGNIQCPYVGKKVIVVEFRGHPTLHDGPKVGWLPFMYKGVPIKLWK